MDNHLFTLLDSPDRMERAHGIKLLAQEATPDALHLLKQMSEQERDPDLQRLIQKARRHIKQRIDHPPMPVGPDGEFLRAIADDPPRRKTHPVTAAGISWETALIDVAIYLLIMVGATIVGTLLVNEINTARLSDAIAGYSNTEVNRVWSEWTMVTGEPDPYATRDMVLAQFQSPPIIAVMLNSITGNLMTLVLLGLGGGIAHLFATRVMEGTGTLRDLIHRSLAWILGGHLLSLVAALIYGMVTTELLIRGFSAYDGTDTSMTQVVAIMGDFLMVLLAYLLFTLIYFVGWSIGIARLIARNYQFSTIQGCATIIVTYMASAVFGCVMSMFVSLSVFSMSAYTAF